MSYKAVSPEGQKTSSVCQWSRTKRASCRWRCSSV